MNTAALTSIATVKSSVIYYTPVASFANLTYEIYRSSEGGYKQSGYIEKGIASLEEARQRAVVYKMFSGDSYSRLCIVKFINNQIWGTCLFDEDLMRV